MKGDLRSDVSQAEANKLAFDTQFNRGVSENPSLASEAVSQDMDHKKTENPRAERRSRQREYDPPLKAMVERIHYPLIPFWIGKYWTENVPGDLRDRRTEGERGRVWEDRVIVSPGILLELNRPRDDAWQTGCGRWANFLGT